MMPNFMVSYAHELAIVVTEANHQNNSLSYHMRHPYCLLAACPNGHPYAIGDVSNVCIFIKHVPMTVYTYV